MAAPRSAGGPGRVPRQGHRDAGPRPCSVREVDGGRGLELETADEDRGRVIGRQGRVAKALRAILVAVAAPGATCSSRSSTSAAAGSRRHPSVSCSAASPAPTACAASCASPCSATARRTSRRAPGRALLRRARPAADPSRRRYEVTRRGPGRSGERAPRPRRASRDRDAAAALRGAFVLGDAARLAPLRRGRALLVRARRLPRRDRARAATSAACASSGRPAPTTSWWSRTQRRREHLIPAARAVPAPRRSGGAPHRDRAPCRACSPTSRARGLSRAHRRRSRSSRSSSSRSCARRSSARAREAGRIALEVHDLRQLDPRPPPHASTTCPTAAAPAW